MSKNPNNCETCDYKRMQYEGSEKYHCYMFADAPTERCMQHKTDQLKFGTVVAPVNPLFRESVDVLLAGGDMGEALGRLARNLKKHNENNVKPVERKPPVLRVVK